MRLVPVQAIIGIPHTQNSLQRKIQEIKAPFATNAGRCSSKLKQLSACWIQTNQDQPNFWHDGSLSQETCHEWSQISTQMGCMPSAETWVRVGRQNVKRSTRMPCTPKSGSAPTPFSRSPLEPHRLQKSQMLHDSTKTMPAPAFCEQSECHSKDLSICDWKRTRFDRKCAEKQQESPAASECLLRPSLWPQSVITKILNAFDIGGRCIQFLPSSQNLFTKTLKTELAWTAKPSLMQCHVLPHDTHLKESNRQGRTRQVTTFVMTRLQAKVMGKKEFLSFMQSDGRRWTWSRHRGERASVVRFRQCTVYETHCHIPAAEIPEHVARVDLCAELIKKKHAQAQANNGQQKLG